MKKQSNILFTNISQDQIKQITTVVKETLALSINKPVHKIFSVAELWDIQRRKRTFTSRRFSF